MNAIQVRRVLNLAFVTTFAVAMTRAQTPSVQKFQILVSSPAYARLPIWIDANLNFPLEARYPYHEDPGDFGPNRLEVKRDNKMLDRLPFKPWVVLDGPLNGSMAPVGSPKNRLPLHLQYALDNPGIYSVRWTVVRHGVEGGRITETIVAQSDWVDFQVRQSTSEQRKDWFEKRLESVPGDAGAFVGDFLPSILANAPDIRTLNLILEQMYSTDRLIRGSSFGSLRFFRDEDIGSQVVEMLRLRGPNEGLSYVISAHAPLFQDRKDELVQAILPFLHLREDWQAAATLKMLGFLVHSKNYSWTPKSNEPAQSDDMVLKATPELIARGSGVSQELAVYLGNVKSAKARDSLWQVAELPDMAHEQALIALTWIADRRDLPRISALLLTPGNPDTYGRDLSSLPYHLVRAYGDSAVPFLERALSESPYAFVRTQSAEQLALLARPAAFDFFRDAVEKNRFYKPELVAWLKTNFPKEIPGSADDLTVLEFLKARAK
jgi:hypothetical protein